MIFKSEIRPYKRLALKYLTAYADHPAIAAATRYMHDLIYNAGKAPDYPSRRLSPHQRSLRYIARLRKHGVRAEEALALIIAMHTLREHDKHTFVNDAHFDAMVAHHFCRLVPGPWISVWRGGVGGRSYDRISCGLRKYLVTKFRNTIGGMALGCARALLAVETLENGLLRNVNVPIAFTRQQQGTKL